MYAPFGGDHNDPVGPAGAINGGGAGVLQHFQGSDLMGIDRIDVHPADPVDDVERVEARVDGADAPDPDLGGLAGRITVDIDIHAGDLSFEGLGDVGNGPVQELIAFEADYRAGEIGFLYRSVADDDDVVEALDVLDH